MQKPAVPKNVEKVFYPMSWSSREQPPKSINTCFLKVLLNIILSGLISRCTIFKAWIILRDFLIEHTSTLFIYRFWQSSVENSIQSSLITKSNPIIFFTFGPIYNTEKSKAKKYSFRVAIKILCFYGTHFLY